ncbi:hypothetical protein Tco_0445065 [Tanacetum coccineum]
MPFGLKNAGATNQRLVEQGLLYQIRRNLENTIDDMVIKRTSEEDNYKISKKCLCLVTKKTTDSEEAFRSMKELMEILPTLIAPIKGEVLVMYLTTSVESISVMLLAEREERQVPIYIAKELGEHDIEFGEHGSRKTQIPKDFSIEMPPEEGEKVETRKVAIGKEGPKLGSIWKLYTNGASSSDGSGARLMLISPEGR